MNRTARLPCNHPVRAQVRVCTQRRRYMHARARESLHTQPCRNKICIQYVRAFTFYAYECVGSHKYTYLNICMLFLDPYACIPVSLSLSLSLSLHWLTHTNLWKQMHLYRQAVGRPYSASFRGSSITAQQIFNAIQGIQRQYRHEPIRAVSRQPQRGHAKASPAPKARGDKS